MERMESASKLGLRHASMRKGTHSCLECRRRKVRCVFSADDQTTCKTCRKKGKICQEQRREHFPPPGGKKTSLKERVTKLEALLQSSGIEIDEDSIEGDPNLARSDVTSPHEQTSDRRYLQSRDRDQTSSIGNEGYRSQSIESPSEDEYDPDPLVSLFNNGVWQSQGPKDSMKIADTYQLNVNHRVEAKRYHVLAMLRSSLISPYLLRDILNATSGWWQGWRPLGPWPIEYTTAAQFSTLQEFLLFAYNAETPAVVGLAVLCIAECIRKLTMPIHEELIQQLPRPPQELFQILFERVDRLINADSDFSNTKEGIDCLMMSGKLFQSLGLPKRTWLIFHKAIVYGQFLGLHQAMPLPGESKEDRHVRQNAWDNICQTDLFISMTLGLPYVANGRNIAASYYGEAGSPMWFQRQVMDAAAQLIDRNQSGLMNAEEPTRAITKILDNAAAQMTSEFWEAPQVLTQAGANRLQAIQWTTKQMFYWLVRLFTHLPFSIQSIEQPHLEAHRLACQAGCRGMLTIYNILRSDKKADIANLIDYQAFISSSILLLGLLGYGNSPRSFSQVDHNPDRDLVYRTLQVLHKSSTAGNNAIAASALQGLEVLFNMTDPSSGCVPQGMDIKDVRTKITIPYIGIISVAPGEQLKRAHSSSPEPAPPLPVFSFAHQMVTGSPPQVFGAQKVPLSGVLPGLVQAGLVAQPDIMDTEFTSIDFEFDNLMATNPGDWSWISSEVHPDDYY